MKLVTMILAAALAIPLASAIVGGDTYQHVRWVEFRFEDETTGEPISFIAAGTTVVWTFGAERLHPAQVVAVSSATTGGVNTESWSSPYFPGKTLFTYSRTLTAPGVIVYEEPHYGRTGTIVVRS